VARLAATAALLAEQSGGSGFSAAQYRDAIGTGRTLAIQILEFFDGIGVTRRSGDLRRMQPDYLLIVGVAEPFLAKEKPNNPAQPPKNVKAPPGRTQRADRRTA
jgi:selenocysteine-specific elongation factor